MCNTGRICVELNEDGRTVSVHLRNPRSLEDKSTVEIAGLEGVRQEFVLFWATHKQGSIEFGYSLVFLLYRKL
jgi:hypothetical protein